MAGHAPAKVVYINTQYIETDATSFKSVVQNLTGKDSVVAGDSPRGNKSRRNKKSHVAGEVRRPPIKAERSEYYWPEREAVQPEMMGCRSSLMRDVSFKDFDRLLKDLPSLDDFHTLFD